MNFVRSENKIIHLLNKKIKNIFPQIVLNIHKEELTIIKKEKAIYRFLSFIEGKFLSESKHSQKLFSNFGKILGKINKELLKVEDKNIESRKIELDIKHLNFNSKYLNYIEDIEGKKLVESLTKRINYIKDKKYDQCPTVLAIEWIDPFFTAGHWVPEMIESVGARNLISKKGEHSRKMTFDEIKNANPDIIILMPCGFDVERTIKEYKKNLEKNSKWKTLKAVKRQNVFAVDANSFFSKPSLRTIIGMEILGKIIQSKVFADLMVPVKSYRKIN